MRRETLKDSLYGGLVEITKNPRLYRFSEIGKEYCYFTEAGKEEIIEWISNHAKEIATAEEIILNERAKKLVLDELKR
jgi:hypothetical protein